MENTLRGISPRDLNDFMLIVANDYYEKWNGADVLDFPTEFTTVLVEWLGARGSHCLECETLCPPFAYFYVHTAIQAYVHALNFVEEKWNVPVLNYTAGFLQILLFTVYKDYKQAQVAIIELATISIVHTEAEDMIDMQKLFKHIRDEEDGKAGN